MEDEGKRKKYRKKPNITIGTDPEFALMDKKGRIQSAANYDFFSGTHPSAKIGCDGSGTPVEIRPSPVDICDIKSLDDDIVHIYSKIAGYLKGTNYHIEGGAMAGMRRNSHPLSIGAHIHFGGSEFKTQKDRGMSGLKQSEDILRQENINRLVRCLNTYLTPIVNFFIERDEIAARRRTGYGKLGDWRRQQWGIEYRTPYSFLLTPLLTGGIYALSALIAFNYKKLNPDKNIYRDVAQYYETLTEPVSEKIQKSIYKKIKPKIISLLRFNSPNPDYNSKIISLFSLIEQRKIVKSKNVLKNYNINPIKEKDIFNVIFSESSSIRGMKDLIKNKIQNKNAGHIYIYRLEWDSWSRGRKRAIRLSKGLPIKFGIPKMEIIEFDNDASRRYCGYHYSIGLNTHVIDWLYQNVNGMNLLVKYLNNLKLRRTNI